MKIIKIIMIILMFFIGDIAYSQEINEFPLLPSHRVIDKPSTTRIIYQRLDGSVYEKYSGDTHMRKISSDSTSNFDLFAAALQPIPGTRKIYIRLNGDKYLTYDFKTWFKYDENIEQEKEISASVKSFPNTDLEFIEFFPNPANSQINLRFKLTQLASGTPEKKLKTAVFDVSMLVSI